MSLFNKNKKTKTGGLMDVIRCDEPSYLIWKWHPAGSQQGENSRENAIRWGSSLRVKDGEVAVFVYHQKNDIMEDFIEGPFDEILKTKNLPVLANIIGLIYEGDTPFQAEVYFINLSRVIQVPVAVPYFDIFDSRFPDTGVPIAVRGKVTFNIGDYRQFIKMHRLINFNIDDFNAQVKDSFAKNIKASVINALDNKDIPLIQIERQISSINEIAEERIRTQTADNYGINVVSVEISALDIDTTSKGYQTLKSVTQDILTETVRTQAEINIRNLQEMQKINIENTRETLRIQREEGQFAQHMQTKSSNLAAFQTEQQAAVAIAGAEAFGKISANGATDIPNGGSANPAAIMTGVAMGGVIGKNMTNMMNGMMQGISGQQASQQIMPPPLPNNDYYVAVDGEPAGPFDMNLLLQMATEGTLTKTSLVWNEGMAAWSEVQSVQELSRLFETEKPQKPSMPPIPPSA